MYRVVDSGVFKKVETWRVVIPLHDNDNVPFDAATINGVVQELLLDYPGFSIVNTVGYWTGKRGVYEDKNQEIIIDTLPNDVRDSSEFFTLLKRKLQQILRQEKIYITKESDKEEFLSFDEFFGEVGIEVAMDSQRELAKLTVQRLVGDISFVLQRLGYETTVLRRDQTKLKIIWERRLCGVSLYTELDDALPADVRIVAADQLSELGDALLGEIPFAVIGSYEFQFYILDASKHSALADVHDEQLPIDETSHYISPEGDPLTVKRFVEEFTMSVVTNCVILREEGYLPNEIGVNVGSDGSMQVGSTPGASSTLLICPAIIPHEEVQREILRCIGEASKLYETNTIDPIALMRAKAKNNYFLKRAFVRKMIRESLLHQDA